MLKINRDKIVWRKVDQETVILNLDTGYYYTLDELGGYIWELALEENDLDKIIEHVVERYDTDRATAEVDVKSLLDDMTNEGFFISGKP